MPQVWEGKKPTHPIEPAWKTLFFFHVELVVGWTTHFEKYDRQNGIMSPNNWGWILIKKNETTTQVLVVQLYLGKPGFSVDGPNFTSNL